MPFEAIDTGSNQQTPDCPTSASRPRPRPCILSPYGSRTDPATAAGFQSDDRDLRPQHMHDMVGQREGMRLEIAVDAASNGEPLGHILFDGPPGLGKTTFAMCIPRDLGVGFQIASGAALMAPGRHPYLTNAEERSVLFIDEIHRLPKAVEEFCIRRWRIFGSTSRRGSERGPSICR